MIEFRIFYPNITGTIYLFRPRRGRPESPNDFAGHFLCQQFFQSSFVKSGIFIFRLSWILAKNLIISSPLFLRFFFLLFVR